MGTSATIRLISPVSVANGGTGNNLSAIPTGSIIIKSGANGISGTCVGFSGAEYMISSNGGCGNMPTWNRVDTITVGKANTVTSVGGAVQFEAHWNQPIQITCINDMCTIPLSRSGFSTSCGSYNVPPLNYYNIIYITSIANTIDFRLNKYLGSVYVSATGSNSADANSRTLNIYCSSSDGAIWDTSSSGTFTSGSVTVTKTCPPNSDRLRIEILGTVPSSPWHQMVGLSDLKVVVAP
jgi:hypothetical protein